MSSRCRGAQLRTSLKTNPHPIQPNRQTRPGTPAAPPGYGRLSGPCWAGQGVYAPRPSTGQACPSETPSSAWRDKASYGVPPPGPQPSAPQCPAGQPARSDHPRPLSPQAAPVPAQVIARDSPQSARRHISHAPATPAGDTSPSDSASNTSSRAAQVQP